MVAVGRGEGAGRLVAVVPRALGRTERTPTEPELWEGTTVALPAGWPGRWRCALSGLEIRAEEGALPVADLFRVLPAALLLAESGA